MNTAAAIAPVAADPAVSPSPLPLTADVAAPAISRPPAPAVMPDLRLVIEADDTAAGGFVYKTLDRRTGEVVNQWPRESLMRLMEAEGYAAGDVIRASA